MIDMRLDDNFDHLVEDLQKLTPVMESAFAESFKKLTSQIDDLENHVDVLEATIQKFKGNVVVEFAGKSGSTQDGLVQLTQSVQTEVNQIDENLKKLNTAVTSVINLKMKQDEIEKLKMVQIILNDLSTIYKQTTSIHTTEVKQLDLLEKAEELHKKLNELETKSTHIIEVKMVDKDGNDFDPEFKPADMGV
jgi:DNA repair exonuclease SbcCD ATPase subunit